MMTKDNLPHLRASGNKVSGASINGYVKYVTTHRETFSGSTDQNGIFSHTWRIGGNANTGTFKAHADASGNEGKSGSGEKSFQVIAKSAQDIQSISPSECSNEPGSAGLKFPQDKRTECEKEEYDECQENRKVNGREWGGGRCDNMYELFWDDDCFGFENSRECNEWFNNGKEKFCENYPNHKKCSKPAPPYCDENTPPGQLCRDEIDDCTDESGCGQNPIVPEPILDCFDDNGRWVPCEDEPPVDDPCVENPGGLGCPRIPEDPVEPKDPIVYDDGEVEEEEEDDNEDSSGGSDSNGNSGSGGAGNGGDGSNGDGDNGGNGDSNNNGEVFE